VCHNGTELVLRWIKQYSCLSTFSSWCTAWC